MAEAGAKDKLFLFDGTYAVFRAFFAIQGLRAADGTPTGGVFGFVNTVRKLLRENQPAHFGVAFDVEGPTHRDEIFEDYKANRPEPPDDLVPQFGLAMEAATVLGWPVLTAPGFEADDVLATLAGEAKARGLDVVLVTADKDLYQLVDADVVVLNPAKDDRVLDPAGVLEVFGARPDQVVDVLSLMGDATDNVPGVPGVGEKTAKAMIRRYDTLDAALARARLFRAVWQAKERALVALEAGVAGDAAALDGALAALVPAARELAALEERLGGDEAAEFVARFGAAAGLTASTPERALRKALKELESRTQPKVWLSLADNEAAAHFSKQLVTVRADAPVALDLDRMRAGHEDRAGAVALFRRLGFRTLQREFESASEAAAAGDAGGEASAPAAPEPTAPAAPSRPAPPPALSLKPGLFDAPAPATPAPAAAPGPAPLGASLEVAVLDDLAALKQLAKTLAAARPLAVDTETDSLVARASRLVGVSLAWNGGGGAYLPVGHKTGEPQAAWDDARPVLARVLEDPGVPKAGQNLKYDRAALRAAGVVVQGIVFDTLIAAQLLDPGRTTSHRLDDLATRYLGVGMIPYSEVSRSGGVEQTLDQVGIAAVARYAVEDAVVALRLVAPLEAKLREEGLWRLFEEIEMPLVAILEEMEHEGVRIDVERLAAMGREIDAEMARLEGEIFELAGHPFNVGSPPQLRTVLFDELKLQPTGRKTTKTKAHSTSQEDLEALAEDHPLPAKVLDYRELAKLKGTYVDALPKLVDPRDGRVHTQFHQLGAATGRLSSSDPNLQNIPIRTPIGKRIREAFVPDQGSIFVSADYSQMELRILAHLSGDPELSEAFRRDLDIHRYTAALVTGVPLEEVTAEMRSRAKAVNFGIIYGMSEFRLAREQGLTREDARAFIEAYFKRYPKVKGYLDSVMAEVQRTGQVRTLFGRIRRFPELRDATGQGMRLPRAQRDGLLRQAVNAPIQGTAADIVKKAMSDVTARLAAEGLSARLLLQVHDELLLECPEREAAATLVAVRESMEGAVRLSVPLRVEARTGATWAAAH